MRPPHVSLAACGALLLGCAGPTAEGPVGPHHQYVVRELHVPASQPEALEFGLDLDGDQAVDNQLGMVFAALDRNDLGVGSTAREALARGGLILLAELQTPAFDVAPSAGLVTYLGRDPMPAPCGDPARLETCGQHLRGDGVFTVDDASASDLGVAPIEDGTFAATIDRLPIAIALISPTEPLRITLHAARVRMTPLAADAAAAIIAGGVSRADIDGVVIPQTAQQLDRIVTTECGQPTGGTRCGCAPGSRADVLVGVFDTDRDCRVDVAEVASNGLIETLFTPDVTVAGEPLLSFGVGVELTTASFARP